MAASDALFPIQQKGMAGEQKGMSGMSGMEGKK